jgi:hypothetical protein
MLYPFTTKELDGMFSPAFCQEVVARTKAQGFELCSIGPHARRRCYLQDPVLAQTILATMGAHVPDVLPSGLRDGRRATLRGVNMRMCVAKYHADQCIGPHHSGGDALIHDIDGARALLTLHVFLDGGFARSGTGKAALFSHRACSNAGDAPYADVAYVLRADMMYDTKP